MSGHSKWSTIKHRKAIKDQKRGALFSRLSRDIRVAVSEGGSGDSDQNPRLRVILDKARAANMSADKIAKAIACGAGETDKGKLDEVVYEGYGPSGVAVICLAKTNSRQRTGALIRNIFERAGGSLGGPGSAAFLFDKRNGEFVAKVKLPVQEEVVEKLKTFVDELLSTEEVLKVYSNAELTE